MGDYQICAMNKSFQELMGGEILQDCNGLIIYYHRELAPQVHESEPLIREIKTGRDLLSVLN